MEAAQTSASAGTTTVAAVGSIGMGASVETLLFTIVAMVVLRFELLRRSGGWGPSLSSREAGRYAENLKHIMKRFAPEAAGLVAILTLAAALRARGDTAEQAGSQTWEDIKAQWPMLITADTLLSLQAMLRLTLLLSVVLRGPSGPTPLSDESAILWLCGAAARAALLARTTVYMMDGPLGGAITASFEVAAVPVLLGMARARVVGKSLVTVLLMVAGTAVFAFRNRLALAEEDALSDSLFMFAHCSDALAAMAYLLRTALIDSALSRADISVGFAHLIMPVQASLSAYYFLQAFPFVQELVGEGQPFEVLQIANTGVLGMYLGAAALYVADCLEGEPRRSGAELQSTLVDTPRASRARRSIAM